MRHAPRASGVLAALLVPVVLGAAALPRAGAAWSGPDPVTAAAPDWVRSISG
jgi:hypothetical protein